MSVDELFNSAARKAKMSQKKDLEVGERLVFAHARIVT